MPAKSSIAETLANVFDACERPLYVVDPQRRVVYCNPALAAWFDLERKRIVGRRVEFHSEEPRLDDLVHADSAPLTDLCPPPAALAGEAGSGTISCQGRDGHLRHRAAEFVPLGHARPGKKLLSVDAQPMTVLVLLSHTDMTLPQIAAEVSRDSTADELHLAIRRFRRGQAQRFSIQSLLGSSSAMNKIRAQTEAAGTSGAHALVVGRRGSGRAHIARAIHYRGTGGGEAALLPIDCCGLTDDLLQRTLERLRATRAARSERSTLILENLESMPPEHQALLLSALRQHAVRVRVVATLDADWPNAPVSDQDAARDAMLNRRASKVLDQRRATDRSAPVHDQEPAKLPHAVSLDPVLVDAISTIVVRVPRLCDRLEDLPVLAQFFLEACNRNNAKQIGALRPDALDALAMYTWPGELDQLRATIESAHATCGTHEIAAADLPPIFYHAVRAASHARQPPEPIVLDELLATIEREAITRALAQAGGNKSEAATLLGMTRPRLYRRLVQLGLIREDAAAAADVETPEFIEQDGAQ